MTKQAGNPQKAADRPMRGIATMLASMMTLSIMLALAKNTMGHYDVLEVVFFRLFFMFIPCIATILWQRRYDLFTTQDKSGHFWRALVGWLTMLCMFYSYKLLPLADATAIGLLGPICATLVAMIVLHEKAKLSNWAALLSGFVGVIIMLQPDTNEIKLTGIWVALLGAGLYGAGMLRLRMLGRTEHALTTVLFFSLFGSLATACTLPFIWVTPSAHDLGLLALVGITGYIGQILVTQAYQYAPAAIISPFTYSTLVWATLFGFLFWGEKPTPHILTGALVIICVGIGTTLYEAHQQRRANRQIVP